MSHVSPALLSIGTLLPTAGGLLSVNASSSGLGVSGTLRFILKGTHRLPVFDFDLYLTQTLTNYSSSSHHCRR